jgi:hypothetical protein
MDLRDADGAAAHRAVALPVLLDRMQWPFCHKWSFIILICLVYSVVGAKLMMFRPFAAVGGKKACQIGEWQDVFWHGVMRWPFW